MFGLSSSSAASSHDVKDNSSRHSKETATISSLPGSPSTAPKRGFAEDNVTPRHQRTKRSVDASKPADRLSLFGSGFVGSLGKSSKTRKAPPRYSS